MTTESRAAEWSARAAQSLRWLHSRSVSIPAPEIGGRSIVDRTTLDGSDGRSYPEITGYTLSVLESIIELGRSSDDDAALAGETALFLEGMLRRHDGGVLGPARQRSVSGRRYTFDTGMALKGLAAHFLRTRTPERDVLARAVAFLHGSIDDDGAIRPFGAGDHAWADLRWSTRPGPYLLKAALGLACGHYGLHGALLERPVLERAMRRALQSRDAHRMFVVEPPGTVHMHAHLYACEAAYLLGAWLGSAEAFDAAHEGVERALRMWDQHGSLPAFAHLDSADAERSDTIAQLLRLCLLLDVGSAGELEALSARLAAYQHEETGALRFGSDYDCPSGAVQSRHMHLSTHATLFAVQAWLGLTCRDVVTQWRERPWTFA